MVKINLDKFNLRIEDSLRVNNMLLSVDHDLSLESLWMLMDMKWNHYQCDNYVYDAGRYGNFYQDPVWILNGLFIEEDLLSQKIRESIACTVISLRPKRILDWGGGLGALARKIAELDSTIQIDIYEPYPSYLAINMCSTFESISFIDQPTHNQYDLVVCTDVLEHLADPMFAVDEIYNLLKPNSYVIFANCFYPVIKCHLPRTFHLRYTFPFICRLKGLKLLHFSRESFSHLYRKQGVEFPNTILSLVNILSKTVYPLLFFLDRLSAKAKLILKLLLRKSHILP